jgi:Protein of unknown function (DUF1579)
MTSRLLTVCAVVSLLAAPVARTQDKGKPPDEPGPIHKELARRVGEYVTVSKFSLKPGEAPMESKGNAKIKSAVDGRFLLEEHTGTMLGKPYTGLRLVGYNNATKKYEAIWTYSMATGMMSLAGTGGGDGKTIDWVASYVDGQGEKQTLYVLTRFVDDDHFTVELYSKTPEGKGVSMETTYTRKK